MTRRTFVNQQKIYLVVIYTLPPTGEKSAKPLLKYRRDDFKSGPIFNQNQLLYLLANVEKKVSRIGKYSAKKIQLTHATPMLLNDFLKHF